MEFTARYLGGHPLIDGPRKVHMVLGDTSELMIKGSADSLGRAVNYNITDPGPAAPDYHAAPLMGLFGGARAEKSTVGEMQRQQDRRLTLGIMYDGRPIQIELTEVRLKGRSRHQKRADFRAGDWNGVRRLCGEVDRRGRIKPA